jgi:hypothetical protein
MVLPLSCFAGFLLVSDCHIHSAGLAMWVNVGGRSKLVQVVSYGKGHHCYILYLYLYLYIFPL